MENTIKIVACSLVALHLLLGVACKKPAVVVESPPEPAKILQSRLIGVWHGIEKKGDVFTITFTKNEWTSTLEDAGLPVPQYKGTYTTANLQVDLQITHEVDIKTMGWIPQKGNFGPNLSGKFSNNVLKIVPLTDAELRKRY